MEDCRRRVVPGAREQAGGQRDARGHVELGAGGGVRRAPEALRGVEDRARAADAKLVRGEKRVVRARGRRDVDVLRRGVRLGREPRPRAPRKAVDRELGVAVGRLGSRDAAARRRRVEVVEGDGEEAERRGERRRPHGRVDARDPLPREVPREAPLRLVCAVDAEVAAERPLRARRVVPRVRPADGRGGARRRAAVDGGEGAAVLDDARDVAAGVEAGHVRDDRYAREGAREAAGRARPHERPGQARDRRAAAQDRRLAGKGANLEASVLWPERDGGAEEERPRVAQHELLRAAARAARRDEAARNRLEWRRLGSGVGVRALDGVYVEGRGSRTGHVRAPPLRGSRERLVALGAEAERVEDERRVG